MTKSRSRNTNQNLLPVPISRTTPQQPSQNRRPYSHHSNTRHGSGFSIRNRRSVSRSPNRSDSYGSGSLGPSNSSITRLNHPSKTNRSDLSSHLNTSMSDQLNPSYPNNVFPTPRILPGPSNTSMSDLSSHSYASSIFPGSSYSSSVLSAMSNISVSGLASNSFGNSDFPGSSYTSYVLPGSSNASGSGLPGVSYPSRTVLPSLSDSNKTVTHDHQMVSKPLNIDEFGSMDSDNEDDTSYSHQTGGSSGGGMSRTVVNDSIDGVPINDSIIYGSGIPSNMNFEHSGFSQCGSSDLNNRSLRDKEFTPYSSDKLEFSKGPQLAMQTFVKAVKDPESLKAQPKNIPSDRYMLTPISSIIREKFMLADGYTDLTSSNDTFIQPGSIKEMVTSMKGKFMRPEDSMGTLSPNERRKTYQSSLHSASQPASDTHGQQMSLDTNLRATPSVNYPISRDTDMRTNSVSSKQQSSSHSRDRGNQRNESRADDRYRTRKPDRKSSRGSPKGSKKDEIKSVKLSWHSTPVDRRRGESEASDLKKNKRSENPLLKCLKQTSKVSYGRVKEKKHDQKTFDPSSDDMEIEEDDTDHAPARNSSVGRNIEPALPTTTHNQSFSQNSAMGLPTNAVIPQEQGYMQNIMGLHGNVMVSSDQGFIMNNMGLPTNYVMHPDQRFIQSGGMGLASNLTHSDQVSIQNTNMSLHSSTLQSIQEAYRQQEAFMIQNSIMRSMPRSNLQNITQPAMQHMLQTAMQGISQTGRNNIQQQSTQPLMSIPGPDIGLQTPTMRNIPQPDVRNMIRPSMQTAQGNMTQQPMRNKAPPATPAMLSTTKNVPPPVAESILPPAVRNRPPPSTYNRPPPVTQNRSFPNIQKRPPTSTDSVPSIVPSVPPPPMVPPRTALANTVKSPVNEVIKELGPDGTGSVKYPAPDTNLLTFDPEVGYRYDAQTGLHYDANSGYFFNTKLKVFLYWDLFTQTYLRVENPTIPFPVLRNQKDSLDTQPSTGSPGAIINMKMLIEQHRQVKLEQDKPNQEMLSRSRRRSRSVSGGPDCRGSRSRKTRGSSSQSDEQRKYQRASRSPTNVRQSSIYGKNQRRVKQSISPSPKERSVSPRSSTRKNDNQRRSGSPGTNRRHPLPRPPQRRRSSSKSPKGVSKRCSASPGTVSRKNYNRNMNQSPDNSRRHLVSRSPLRRVSRSKSPPRLTKRLSPSSGHSSRRMDNQNRSRSPDNNRRHPVSRSPLRRRRHSKSPSGLRRDNQNKSKSPVNSRRLPVSRSPQRKRSRSRSLSGLAKKRSLSPGLASRRRDIRNTTRSPDNSRRHPIPRSPLKRGSRSLSPPGKSKRRSPSLTRRREKRRRRSKTADKNAAITDEVSAHSSMKVSVLDPSKSFLVDNRKNDQESIDNETKFSQRSSTKNKQVKEDKNRSPSPKKSSTDKSLDKSDNKESAIDKTKSSTTAEATHLPEIKSSASGSIKVDKENTIRHTKNVQKLESQSTDLKEKYVGHKSESDAASTTRPQVSPAALALGNKEIKDAISKLGDDKSKSTRRNSSRDRQKHDGRLSKTRDDSRSNDKKGSSNKEKDIKPSDKRPEWGDREKSSRNSKPEKQRENSPSEGRNHRLVSERQFSMTGIRFSFPRDDISQSKPRPSSQFDTFLSVKSKEDEETEKVHDISGVPDDLSEFVVIDGVEDVEDMTEEALQSLLADEDDSENQIDGSKFIQEQEQTDKSSSQNKVILTIDHENQHSLATNKSALAGLPLEHPTIFSSETRVDNENYGTTNVGEVKLTGVAKTMNTTQDSTQKREHLPGDSIDKKIQQNIENSKSNEKSDFQYISSYSEPPSPACSIYSSYNFSDDEKYVSAVEDEEIAKEEEDESLKNKCDVDASCGPSKEVKFKTEKSVDGSNDESTLKTSTSDEHSPRTANGHVVNTLKSSEIKDNEANRDGAKKLQTISKADSVPNILTSTDPHQRTESKDFNGVSLDDHNIHICQDSYVEQRDIEFERESTSLEKEHCAAGTSQPVGSQRLEVTGVQADNEDPGLCQSVVNDKPPAVVSQPVIETALPTEIGQAEMKSRMEKDGNEENTSAESKICQLLNEESMSCARSSVPVNNAQTTKNPDKVEDGKRTCSVFSRLGGPSRVSETILNIRVSGDTDPLSDLYKIDPTCIVHLKSSLEGIRKDVVIKESLCQHLFTNGVDYVKMSVNQRNNLGSPFSYIQVTFESKDQAKEWFVNTGRKITLQHTQEMKADYFLYYADVPWKCRNCRLQNIFFRSLCYKCFCHKSGSFTSVRFSEAPTKFLGIDKLPASINEGNVMQHLPKIMHQFHLKSVRIVEDPEMKCCCGLVVVEMTSVKKAIDAQQQSACNPCQVLRYVELDKDSPDSAKTEVTARVHRHGQAAEGSRVHQRVPSQSPKVRPQSQNLELARKGVGSEGTITRRRVSKKDLRQSSRQYYEAENFSPGRSPIYNEIGVPRGFEDYSGSLHSFGTEDLEVSHRLEDRNPDLDVLLQPFHDGTSSLLDYKRSSSSRHFDDHRMTPRRFSDHSLSPPRQRDFSPDRGSSSHGYGIENVRHRSHSRDPSRDHRSRSPISGSRPCPPHHSPLRRRSPQRRRSSPDRQSLRRRNSPPPRCPNTPPHMPISLRAPKPNGFNGGLKYPPPDRSAFQLETNTGLHYDPETRLYYDSVSRLFYNDDLNIYLEYDPIICEYVRVG